MIERTVEGAGVPLRVVEAGEGAATLLIHGMADAAARWPLADVPGRAIAYDRRGYGGSGAPEPYGATTVHEQAEDAAAVLRALDAAPALVCGEDLGALVALDLADRHAGLVRGLVVVDPPLLAFVPEAAEALSAERAALEDALRAGGPAEAVAAWLGPDADPARLERARRAAGAFFADFGAQASWPVRRAQLRGLALPVAVVVGERTREHIHAAADRLCELVPDVRRAHDPLEALRALA